MVETRWRLRVLGGVLCFFGLIGLYVVVVRVMGHPEQQFDVQSESLLRVGSVLLALGVLCSFLANASKPVGHWYQLIDGLKHKPTELYEGVAALFEAQSIPGASLNILELYQRGILSPKRIHLMVTRDSYRFELYATPFGKNFGVSWRCYEKTPLLERILLSLPVVSWVLYVLFYRYTTYHEDCGLFFQDCVQRSVRRAIEEAMSEQGLRALTDADFAPVLEGMKRRWS